MLKDKIKREMALHGTSISHIRWRENGCFLSYCIFYFNVHFALSLGNQPSKKISAEYQKFILLLKMHAFMLYEAFCHIVMSNKSYGCMYT